MSDTYRYKQMWHQTLKAHKAKFKTKNKELHICPIDDGKGGFHALVSGDDGWAKWDISAWRVKCIAHRMNGLPPLGNA